MGKTKRGIFFMEKMKLKMTHVPGTYVKKSCGLKGHSSFYMPIKVYEGQGKARYFEAIFP